MTSTSPSADAIPMVDVVAVHGALRKLLDSGSDDARAVREMFKDENSINDIRLVGILAGAVASGLREPRTATKACMHAHGIEIETDSALFEVHPADGGPNYEFRVIHDVDLPLGEPYYAAGVMISAPQLRILRTYPHTVHFYVIVDGLYRGVRLCTLAVIESLGFSPQLPTLNDPYPSCRSFFTAGEAFHYLHIALLTRGLVVPGKRVVMPTKVIVIDICQAGIVQNVESFVLHGKYR